MQRGSSLSSSSASQLERGLPLSPLSSPLSSSSSPAGASGGRIRASQASSGSWCSLRRVVVVVLVVYFVVAVFLHVKTVWLAEPSNDALKVQPLGEAPVPPPAAPPVAVESPPPPPPPTPTAEVTQSQSASSPPPPPPPPARARLGKLRGSHPSRQPAPGVEEGWQRAEARQTRFREFLQAKDRLDVELRSRLHGHRCLDVQNGNSKGYAFSTSAFGVQLWDCSFDENQRWSFRSDGTIRSRLDGDFCLDLRLEAQRSTGIPLQMTHCTVHARKWAYDLSTSEIATQVPKSQLSDGSTASLLTQLNKRRSEASQEGEGEAVPVCLVATSNINGGMVSAQQCAESRDSLSQQWTRY